MIDSYNAALAWARSVSRWHRVCAAWLWARSTLRVFEDARPGDGRPRAALSLVRDWLSGQPVTAGELVAVAWAAEAARAAAAEAARAAAEAAEAARAAAAAAAWAAAWAAEAARAARAAPAAWAAVWAVAAAEAAAAAAWPVQAAWELIDRLAKRAERSRPPWAWLLRHDSADLDSRCLTDPDVARAMGAACGPVGTRLAAMAETDPDARVVLRDLALERGVFSATQGVAP